MTCPYRISLRAQKLYQSPGIANNAMLHTLMNRLLTLRFGQILQLLISFDRNVCSTTLIALQGGLVRRLFHRVPSRTQCVMSSIPTEDHE